MTALAKAEFALDCVEYYEVQDILSGQVIGRISGQRVQCDGALGRSLERHGFRLVAFRTASERPFLRLTSI
jgi:hypothetical protein